MFHQQNSKYRNQNYLVSGKELLSQISGAVTMVNTSAYQERQEKTPYFPKTRDSSKTDNSIRLINLSCMLCCDSDVDKRF